MTTLYYTEEVKTALEAFANQQDKTTPITEDLTQIVVNISKTGVSCYPWGPLKQLLTHLLQEVLQRYHAKTLENRKGDFNVEQAEIYKKEEEEFEQKSQKFFQALGAYEDAPFTLQRLCELVLAPEKTYASSKKYFTALEKMVNITSTIQTLTPQEIQTINTTGVVTAIPPNPMSLSNFPENAALFQQHQVMMDGTFNNNNINSESMNIDTQTSFPSSTSSPMELH
jgi:hypothetical protein